MGNNVRGITRDLKRWLETLSRRIKGSSLANHPLALLVTRVVRDLNRDDGTHMAAGVAYYAFISLFPLVLGLLAIGGVVLGSAAGLQEELLVFIADYVPGSAELVSDNVDTVVRYSTPLGIASLVGLFWTASAVFGAITRAINRAWGIRRDRPFYRSKPRQMLMALSLGLLFLASMALSSVVNFLTNVRIDMLGWEVTGPSGLVNLGLRIVPWAITLAIFLTLYKFLPNCKTYWRYIWPGASVAALLFVLAQSLYLWYLKNFAAYDEVYGPLTSVIGLLFWAYLSALIMIIGAEISSEYEKLRGEGKRWLGLKQPAELSLEG
jgi:membrane protein